MCGILGVGGERGSEVVRSLLDDLAHRGPDDSGTWSSPELALGHRRLAIIGLEEGGRQPMVGRAGSVISFNGEIYNYRELADRLEGAGLEVDRRYDTAVLLACLEAWGTSALARLDGMFAFAWYRPRERRLLLARDRWGKKPLFWGRVPLADGRAVLVLSSELRSFTGLPGGPPGVDPVGVARYLVYDGMPGERTVYRGVRKVPAAGWVELDPTGVEVGRGEYWRIDERRQVGLGIEEAESTLERLLARSVDLRLRSDVPVGLFLSGGLDSSLLAATWRRLAPGAVVRTFTAGFDDPSYDERASARMMAGAVDAEHHEVVLSGADLVTELDAVWNHLSEPFADPSIIPFSAICRRARQVVTVALGGDGGDELQAGYDPFRAWSPAALMESLLSRRGAYLACRAAERLLPPSPANLSARFKARHLAQGFLHPAEERIQGWMAGFPVQEAMAVMDPDLAAEVDPAEILEPTRAAFRSALPAGPLYAQIHAWMKTYLECSILTKVDRAGMMHSLEVRAPFLDPELATWLLELPPELIFRQGRGKVLLRRLAHRLLPRELLAKPKKGLGVPQATWLRTVLRDRMEACLDLNRRGGWFRPDRIGAMWRAHLSGRDDHRRALWTFLFSFPFQQRAGVARGRGISPAR